MIHMAKFAATRIWLESTLFRNGLPENLDDMLLLGCVKPKKGDPELLYLITVPQENKQSLNIVQLAASMLGEARRATFWRDFFLSAPNFARALQGDFPLSPGQAAQLPRDREMRALLHGHR